VADAVGSPLGSRSVVKRQQMSPDDIGEVRRIVLEGLAGHRARVFLFGSWAKGHGSRASDVDVGVLPVEPLPAGLLAGIREALDSSSVLYPVDLVDLSKAAPQFRELVESEGVLWNG
jgi:predicted nucleotidyltransferase